MGYGTAYQQADQANRAALLAGITDSANQARAAQSLGEMQARQDNFNRQQALQLSSPATLNAAYAGKMDPLIAGASALYQPYNAEANLLSALSGGGQVATPQSAHIKKPGALDYTLGFISSLSGGGMGGGGGGW